MYYISATEAAQRWGVSTRQVQRLLLENRIPGAMKHGRAWLVPAAAEKPEDLRKDRPSDKTEKDTLIRMSVALPLISGVFAPGKCGEAIEMIKDPDQRQIAQAEYCFFSAQPEKAMELCEAYTDHEDMAIRLSALLLQAFSALPGGNIKKALWCIQQINSVYEQIENKNVSNEMRATAILFTLAPAVLMHIDHPKTPLLTPYIRYLPDGLQLLGYYVCAHAVYLRGDYGEVLGIAKSALHMHREKHVIAEIFLSLVMAMALINLKRPDEAQDCFMAAWRMAEPDQLIQGFAMHHGLLQGLVETCLKRSDPVAYGRVIAATCSFSAGWRQIHNPVMNRSVADNLTTIEFTVAMLANRGWTNMEISSYLNLSVHTVKKYMSDVYQKLGISSRKELHQYMLT